MRDTLGLPPAMFDILTDVAVDDPDFIYRYIVPTLTSPDAYDRVLSDLCDARMAVDLEEAGLGNYDGLGSLGKSFLKKVGQALKKVALAPIKAREAVAHAIVGAVKGKEKASAPPAPSAVAAPPPPPAPAPAPPPPPPPPTTPIAYSGPSVFASPPASSSSGSEAPSYQAPTYQAPSEPVSAPTPAGASKSSGIQQASMFDGGSLPLLAVGAVLALVFGQKSKKGRVRKNPSRRHGRAVA